MSLAISPNEESLEQKLDDLSSRTAISLDARRLRPTLRDIEVETGPSAVLHLFIDATTPEAKRQAAAHVREIANMIEEAAGVPDGSWTIAKQIGHC